ncbi:MAG TPA: TetR/AcrR family transcriptional regulator C-terminal domain-containing protein [Solirubrobacteraceae bacterium]|jgi:AcrR family transcriptional regulator|nr:TetR/AcrR family transcriptional regulator C-terminal domain-containing protein [Solirubrobacteraceae bacterium]
MSDPTSAAARRQAQPAPPGPARRRRGRPAKLSRQAILAAALALLDREGADALTMRRLGSELGVEAMSLYRHVKDRDELLEGLADFLATELEPQRGEVEWPDALRTFAGELRALARRHPAAFGLVGMQVLATPYVLRPIEEVLASLRSGGFTPARAILAYRLVSSYARGYALAELSGFAIEVAPDVPLPAVRALGRRLGSEPTDSSFRAGLETIIAGLRSQLD